MLKKFTLTKTITLIFMIEPRSFRLGTEWMKDHVSMWGVETVTTVYWPFFTAIVVRLHRPFQALE